MSQKIQSIDEYIQAILSVNRRKDDDSLLFYRGHSDEKYNLIPGIMRSSEQQKKEDFYFHQIRVRCPDAFYSRYHIDQLVKMQHYGCPTRLLDVTSNPLVGLYFACKRYKEDTNQDKKLETQEPQKGKMYIFAIKQSKLLYYDNDRVRMLSCLAELKYEEKMRIDELCRAKSVKLGLTKEMTFDAYSKEREIKKLFYIIRSEVPAFNSAMSIYDLKSDFFVQPLKDNQRIIKQDGAFIIFGLHMNEAEILKSVQHFVCDELTIVNQEQILKDLDALGINEATLFPEIERVAGYLKNMQPLV